MAAKTNNTKKTSTKDKPTTASEKLGIDDNRNTVRVEGETTGNKPNTGNKYRVITKHPKQPEKRLVDFSTTITNGINVIFDSNGVSELISKEIRDYFLNAPDYFEEYK